MLQFGFAEVEDFLDVAADEDRVDEPAAKHRIADVVVDGCAARGFVEAMFMNPGAVGAFALFIDETKGRFPGGDFALPAQGMAWMRKR